MSLLYGKKIFIIAARDFSTGGVELAHQLVDFLNNNGKNAFMIYEKDRQIVQSPLTVTESYRKYNIKVASEVEDKEDNVLILPEVYLSFIPKFKHIQICIWWMSVDNALSSNGNLWESFRYSHGLDRLRVLYHYRTYHHYYSLNRLMTEDYRLTHFYQSVYIQQFLYSLGLSKVVKLSDYINTEIVSSVDNSVKKEDLVLYNPAKGLRYSKKIIKLLPNIKFIPLKGYTREQLNKLFDRAKLYIDFGPFPGKDRLPREAAVHNCCIITGKFGASRYFEDVPIYRKYKFDLTHASYNAIKQRIVETLTNYNDCVKDFEYMRKTIRNEQENFNREIDNIFL